MSFLNIENYVVCMTSSDLSKENVQLVLYCVRKKSERTLVKLEIRWYMWRREMFLFFKLSLLCTFIVRWQNC